jgi:hypothetical protein
VAALRVRGGGCRGERRRPEIEEVEVVADGAIGRYWFRLDYGRQVRMEGRSDHGMKTHEKDEAAERSCAPPVAR